MSEQLLKGLTALVTGGSAGIGKAIALKFAAHGAQIVIFGSHEQRGLEAAQEINREASQACAYFYQVDVSQTQQVDETVKKVLENHGQVDILVNNAGITRDQLLMRMSENDWDRVLDVNLKSCYNLCRALVRPMMKARRGKIINMSSVIALTGNEGQANYAASKAGMVGLTKALAKELAPRNICVNCIAPGYIATRMTEGLSEQQKQNALGQIPLERMGNPEDVAHAALFLASQWADYITGHVLTVDGGMNL